MRTIFAVLTGLLLVGCTQAQPGQRVVFANWGRVDEQCYSEGFYFYNPISYSSYKLDAKVQRHEVKTEAATKDLQAIHATIVVNFALDGKNCHEIIRRVGTDFIHRVIDPAIEEVAKASTALFPVERVIQDRPKLKEIIVQGLRARLHPYGIDVHDVALTNFGFSRDFMAAVEQKQIEEQNVQRAEYKRQQAVKEAERQVALADGQAKSNELIRRSLSSELIQFEMQKKWDGRLPQVTGQGGIPFISLNAGSGK